MDVLKDKIELILPAKAEYVSVARLAVSGIASRMGMDIETIEDIKVAVSEVCSRLVDETIGTVPDYKAVFEVCPQSLSITIFSDNKKAEHVFGDVEDELVIPIIEALMDHTELTPSNGAIITMTKAIEGIRRDGE